MAPQRWSNGRHGTIVDVDVSQNQTGLDAVACIESSAQTRLASMLADVNETVANRYAALCIRPPHIS
jgi:hypothetical protein